MNYRMNPSTFKWKALILFRRSESHGGISKSGLMHTMSLWSGTTALNDAAMRGDVEIVKILLENGADPYVENDLGMNAFDICKISGPFPSVQRALLKHVHDEKEVD